MITTANYVLKTNVNGEVFTFVYETNDVWEALKEFWHEDFNNYLACYPIEKAWPIDIDAMDSGKVISTYHFQFEQSSFHSFYDIGGCTLDEFDKCIRRDKPKVTVIFGEYAAKAYINDGVEGIREHYDEGQLAVNEFDTEAERRAYIAGIDDADGWLGSAVLSDEDAESETVKELLDEH